MPKIVSESQSIVKGVLALRIPETPTTPPVIPGFPPGKSTQGKGIKIVSPKTNG